MSAKRSHWRTVAELAVVAAIALGYYAFQANRLLPTDSRELAPDFSLPTLTGEIYQLSDHRGRPTLVYFFAPWCRVCNASAHNLDDLWDTDRADFDVVMIAIDFADRTTVKEFADRHTLTMPILFGNQKTVSDYRVFAIPTYYVIDADGRIAARDFAYSTELGMRLRLWLAAR